MRPVFALLCMSSLQIQILYLGLSASEPPKKQFLAGILQVKALRFC